MFPCFVMVMCVCAYMTIRNSPQMIGIRQQVASIFLGYNNWWQIAQNASYFEKHTASSPFTHLWYLSVEMQFYLIWPLLFWGYCRLSKRKYKGDIVGNAKYRKLGKEVYQNAKRNDQRRGIAGVCFGGLALLSVFAMILRYVPGQDPSRVYYGTDTMAYTASALSFMLEGLDKPVILTGSQLPIGVLRTDGKENLMTSIEIASALDKNGRPLVPEVCIFFENHLMRGNRTTKMNAENFNAFRSFNYPLLAEAGIHIKYNHSVIHQITEREELKPHYLLDTNIAVLKLFPGIHENVVAATLAIDGLRAVVLETYGSGNAPRRQWFLRLLREANEKGIVIVNVTQCNAGTVEMQRYETGYHLLEAGITCGYDSTTESAITKLMFLLGHGYSPEEIRERMSLPIAGEITI